ncbi:MAG: Holliday junction branch migration protein RuvA [Puniceicoccales bacterium]|nr:Holliday junction branch migration protein RuvA [Puniceicoccales bacterium]
MCCICGGNFYGSSPVIVSIGGILVQSDVLSAVIEANGIGYFVSVPLGVSCKLPPIGSEIKLHTHAIYREDRQELYGFFTREERDFFKLIVEKVSGVGPRSALNIMSKLSLPLLRDAIASGDAEILAKCHGIGKKTAERMIMELSHRDISAVVAKTSASNFQSRDMQSGNITDAIAALVSLGYKASDAERAVSNAIPRLGENPTADAIIRAALSS